jgi:hypothetical protein
MTPEERFWAKVRRGPECWEWTGARTAPGWHGIFAVDATRAGRRMVVAHRYAWELANHLMLGTQRDNAQDASRKGRMARTVLTHCKRGHSFDGNTYIHPGTGRRMCRQCHIERARRWHELNRTSA